MTKSFSQLRQRWIQWLDGPDHPIWRQIQLMVWDDAVYRTINEARGYTTGKPFFAQNGFVASFIDTSYVASQALAVGRLLDRTRDVISLWRLVQEIEQNRTAITRQAFLAAADVPYDFEAAKAAEFRRIAATAKGGVSFSREAVGGSTDWMTAQRLHGQFDRLSAKTEQHRRPGDVVSRRIVQRLKDWLDDPAIKRLADLRHVHIAHAGHRANSQRSQAAGTTMNDVTAAQKALFRTTAAISGVLLQHSSHSTALATPQYDQFRYWDQPMVGGEDIEKLRAWWDRHREGHRTFSNELTEDLLREEAHVVGGTTPN